MKKVINYFVLCFLIVLFHSCYVTKFDCIDKRACKVYEKKLDSLSGYLFFSEALQSTGGSHPAYFFKNLTKEKSEADWSYEGQGYPTVNDYEIWSAWYVLNYNELSYDKKTGIVYVIDDIK